MTCSRCKLKAWRKGLCYTHWREKNGYHYDEKLKVFVDKNGKQAGKR